MLFITALREGYEGVEEKPGVISACTLISKSKSKCANIVAILVLLAKPVFSLKGDVNKGVE